MKYIDLHTDALTKTEGVFQVTRELLERGGCGVQCFAAFLEEQEGRFARALSLCDKFGEMCAREGYLPVRTFSDIREEKLCAMLTVEEGGAVEGDLGKLETLYARGVRMMTLLWNRENEIGYPNFVAYGRGDLGHGAALLREERGLKPFGFSLIERMQELGMLIDVSHASDGAFGDVARLSKRTGIPFLASHSCAAAVFPHARNLTDGQIRSLAECGGIVGLNFCAAFLGGKRSAEGQRRAILAHAAHIIAVGGEDVLAIGSDFDGIPANAYMKNAARMPSLIEELAAAFGSRVAKKIARTNALRVFESVLT